MTFWYILLALAAVAGGAFTNLVWLALFIIALADLLFGVDSDEFTHYASFYYIPCYWNEETHALAGRTFSLDLIVLVLPYVHNAACYLAILFIADLETGGFPILIERPIGAPAPADLSEEP